jgi:hypothetical protein
VKVLYHSGLRAAARAVHETNLMLQACHKNVVQTHHVLMWQRAKAVTDDCTHDFQRGAAGTPVQQQQQQQHVLSPSADAGSLQEDFNAESAAAAAAPAGAGGEASPQPQSERRFSNMHIDNSNGNGVSACGVMYLSDADADAADGWMGHAGMFMDDDEDELEAQTCESSLCLGALQRVLVCCWCCCSLCCAVHVCRSFSWRCLEFQMLPCCVLLSVLILSVWSERCRWLDGPCWHIPMDDDEDELEAQTCEYCYGHMCVCGHDTEAVSAPAVLSCVSAGIVQELCDGGPLDAAAKDGKIASTVSSGCFLMVPAAAT